MTRFPKTLPTGATEAELDERRILVGFMEPTRVEAVRGLAKSVALSVEGDDRELTVQAGREVNHTETRYWLRSWDGSVIDAERFAAVERRLGDRLEFIAPVYRVRGPSGQADLVAALPNVFLLHKRDTGRIERAVGAFGLRVNEPKSTYLDDFMYLELPAGGKFNAFEVNAQLQPDPGGSQYELMPMIRDWCLVPNDTLFAQQWNMAQIEAAQAWDISSGVAAVVVAVIDSGTDLTHPDLQLAGPGIDLGDMTSDGSPNNFGGSTGHGTCCAGIVAATFDNATGVSGVAGACRILPLAIRTFSNVEIASGVNWAVAQGASAISMSFIIPQSALVDTALTAAFAANVVLCAATGNGNVNTVGYPARHADVMAIGASDQADGRKNPASPDGESWGSNFGTEMSVVAPGVGIATTDIQGLGGFNPAAGVVGDYFMTFNGTSAATPHVAGLAALIRSQYPTTTSQQIRRIIERTAERVGPLPYAETAGRVNGTWNPEMGYGRINAFRALDCADVMIKDWQGDAGNEPSTSANFWDFSDIVVRITDDGVFNPGNASQSKNVERGQENFIYVRVTNNGPRDARNVAVNIRITPYVGLQFVYPQDWTATDAMHVLPTALTNTFASIPSGGSAIARFSISAAQIEDLYGWEAGQQWHPCLLAQVTADNDYAYQTSDLSFGNVVVRKNNFAQRNLSVIDVFASALSAFPFVVGSRFGEGGRVRLSIDRAALPRAARVTLSLDDNAHMFPRVSFDDLVGDDERQDRILFEERTRIRARLGGRDVRMTLEPNSSLKLLCAEQSKTEVVDIRGGDLIVQDGRRLVRLSDSIASVDLDIAPRSIHAVALNVEFPRSISRGDEFPVMVSQSDRDGRVVGGATAIYRVA